MAVSRSKIALVILDGVAALAVQRLEELGDDQKRHWIPAQAIFG